MIIKDLQSDIFVQNLSAQQIADRTGLDRKTVSAFLSGENDNPKLSTLQALAKALGGEIIYQTTDSKTAVTYNDISYYRTLIANTQHQLETKDRWIHLLFLTALGLIALNIITLMICYLTRV